MDQLKRSGYLSQSITTASELNIGGQTLDDALEFARATADAGCTIVLVEGVSDQLALRVLAGRHGCKLENVKLVAMGGASNFTHFLELLGPRGLNAQLAGLVDIGEEWQLRRALVHAGFGSGLARSDIESLGFYICNVDLEDELIRSLSARGVLAVIEAQGELTPFRTFQNQPAWRGRLLEEQLRRWIGTKARRKARYATCLVEALDLDRVPAALNCLLKRVSKFD